MRESKILMLCLCFALSGVAAQSKDFSGNQSLIDYPNVQLEVAQTLV